MSALTFFMGNTRTTLMNDAFAKKAKARVYHRATAKTTPEQVKDIMYWRDRRGFSAQRIANKLQLPVTTVQSVINGNGARTVDVMR